MKRLKRKRNRSNKVMKVKRKREKGINREKGEEEK